MSALDRAREFFRLPVMFRRAFAIASDDDQFVRQLTGTALLPGDRVKHFFYGWLGTVDHLEKLETMAGVCVVWDDARVYAGPVDEPVGTPVWYPAMALQKLAR